MKNVCETVSGCPPNSIAVQIDGAGHEARVGDALREQVDEVEDRRHEAGGGD